MRHRVCIRCRQTTLPPDFPGIICLRCQEEFKQELADFMEGAMLDLHDLAQMFRMDEDSVKRAYRKGKFPARATGTKKYLWSQDVIKEWMRAGCPDIKRLIDDLEVLRDQHGDVGPDDLRGGKTAGDRLDIPVQVFSNDESGELKRQTRIITTRIPRHGPAD